MSKKYGCVLLAGGKGSRMGGTNKAELIINGQTFAGMIEAELDQTGMPCYMSQGAYDQEIPEGWTKVTDLYQGSDGQYLGPAAGICSSLVQAEKDGLDGIFCVPCDAPFFEAGMIGKLQQFITEDTDAVCIRTSGGHIQTVFGWYSVHCIGLMVKALQNGNRKLISVLEQLSFRVIDAADAGISERCFTNINRREDYEKYCKGRLHIVIEGKKGAGKTTLIDRLISETDRRICGYRTKILKTDAEGYRHVYMYPADKSDTTAAQEIGITRRRIISVNDEVFEDLGVKLLSDVCDDGVIVMDEIGYMETGAECFCRKVIETFDRDIPVIAAIKDTEKEYRYLQLIKEHPKIQLLRLNEDNREEVYQTARRIMETWEDRGKSR
ncbi:MAG: NTP transferase domain-containing protein [Solobacterium sp.]|nr:NTP transferase domain-containing protein [Solobacterium sp.]